MPEWGEEVVACVVARAPRTRRHPPRSSSSLDALCLARIARFKRPKAYVFLADLPKNNAGKVLKTALREFSRVAKPTGPNGERLYAGVVRQAAA